LPPVASRLPSGEKSIALTPPSWPCSVSSRLPVATSQTHASPGSLGAQPLGANSSPLAEARCVPSGEKASALTAPLAWIVRVSLVVATSHNRIVWSAPPEANVLPSGERARHQARPLCRSSRRVSWPFWVSQKRTAPSLPAEISVLRSGRKH